MSSAAIPATTREIRLAARPEGELRPEHLRLVEVQVREPREGELLVRNDYLLMASAYRELMRVDSKLPIPNFQVDASLTGRAVGTVLASGDPGFAPGCLVEHFFGWSEHTLAPAGAFRRHERDQLPSAEYFLANGPTAWHGMVDMAQVGEGDIVFVSGATSGVGSLAGQIARCRGAARVIGSTGTKSKIDYLVEELRFDAAFDYHDGSVVDQLRKLAPEGITVCFDNVGGPQFEAALQAAAPGARFALCGALSGQVGEDGAGGDGGQPRLDILTVVGKGLTLRGFPTFHTDEQVRTWNEHFARWLGEGRLVYPHTVVNGGLPAAADALIALLRREYMGNVLLKLS